MEGTPLEELRSLIIHGDIDFNLSEGLFEAVRLNFKVTQLLIEEGADVNLRNESGTTPLHRAVIGGDAMTILLLLKNGANPNSQDNDGTSPLMKAAVWDHPHIVRLLLQYGADPNIRDNYGRRAYDLS